MRPARLAVFGLALVACGPAPAPKSSANIAVSRIDAPPGVTLEQACTPTGPELCFNAADDNCNGIIDEGCGVRTGALQFAIAWGDSPADVDLRVTDPDGATIDSSRPGQPDGLHLDRDCPKDDCHGQNEENILFEGVDPPRGRYVVDVVLAETHGAALPVSVTLGARIGNRSYRADLVLEKRDDKKSFAFTL